MLNSQPSDNTVYLSIPLVNSPRQEVQLVAACVELIKHHTEYYIDGQHVAKCAVRMLSELYLGD